METTNPAPLNPAPLRDTFLTVICILTFIGSGWGIVQSVRTYAMADTISTIAAGAMERAQDQMDNQNAPGFIKQILSSVGDSLNPANLRKTAIAKLISCLFTLTGALMMWNLKKTGFYVYILGIAIIVISPIILLGSGLMGAIGAGGSGFVGVIFIILYGVNLKQMKK